MPTKITTQYDNKNINDLAILDVLLNLQNEKKTQFINTLELVDGSIQSTIGKGVNCFNEFTVASIAQNFAIYINKIQTKRKVLVSHDGSLEAILFSKVFASVLISEGIVALFNYENKPLNNALSVLLANQENMDFVVCFSNQIPKKHHIISFYDKDGFLFSSKVSKQINSLISETNFLNLSIPRKTIPTLPKNDLISLYSKQLKSDMDLSNMNVVVSEPFNCNTDLLKELFYSNKIKNSFLTYKKLPKKNNSITRKSTINSVFNSNVDLIFNFNLDINSFEFLVKHKKRWKFLTLNDLALIYIHYQKQLQNSNLETKKVFYSYLSSKYINFFAKKNKIETIKYDNLFDFLSFNNDDILLVTNGSDYFVTENNSTFCSDPILNIKLFIEMASFFKKQGKNLYQVLTSIYIENGIFYFRSVKENLDIETANLFFNKLIKTQSIDNHKVIKISQNKSIPMCFSVLLDNKTSIMFQYIKNKQLLISNYSIWNNKITENNVEDQYIDLIIEQKRLVDDLSSLKEKIFVKKFSWPAFFKYSIFLIMFVLLCWFMFAFILDSNNNTWHDIRLFLNKEKYFAYLIPLLILLCSFQILINCWANTQVLKKLNQKVKLRHIFISNFISISISTITPLIYGGETVGYWYLKRKGINSSAIAAMFLIQSLLTQINIIIFSAIFVPIGFVRFYETILESRFGFIMIPLIIIGTVIDIFSAIMITLLTFSKRMQNFISKYIYLILEWIPFLVIRNNEIGARLKKEFSNINLAAKEIFTKDVWFKNILFFIQLIFYKMISRFFDWSILSAIVGNMINLEKYAFNGYFDMLAAQALVRNVNAINFLIPGGLGISDWATQNIFSSLFKYDIFTNSGSSDVFYNVNVWQTLSRIMFTFSITILSALCLFTVFVGESRIDKYNKIKNTLTNKEIQEGNIKVKSNFYSISIIPWIFIIVGLIGGWYLIYNFVLVF